MGGFKNEGSRVRWAALGAAVAVTIGAGGIAVTRATIGSGERAVYVPITPCRLFDTRAGDQVGPRGAPLAAGETYSQQVRGSNGNCTVPADATAVAMNVTTVNPTAAGFLTIWPTDAARPLASSLNWVPGAPPTPNKVDTKVSADGRISLFANAGTVDVLADLVGYYVDHNHDDRYYTEDEANASRAEVDATIGQLQTTQNQLQTTQTQLQTTQNQLQATQAALQAELLTKADRPTGSSTLVLGPAEFKPTEQDQSAEYRLDFDGFLDGGSGATLYCVSAPVTLPDGATVTALTADGADNSTTVGLSTFLLSKTSGLSISTQMAAVNSPVLGTPGAFSVTTSAITDSTISRTTESYFVAVCNIYFNVILYDVTITYTHPA